MPLISTEGISRVGRMFSHRKGELWELISQRRVINPRSSKRGSAGEKDHSGTGRGS